MNALELDAARCPRCSAALAPNAEACARCGLQIAQSTVAQPAPAAGLVCPRCDRIAEPGSRVVIPAGPAEHGLCPSCGTPLVLPDTQVQGAFEHKTQACAPFELDTLVRAEAVDGWSLVDTTVDTQQPDRILAHFRRPLRAAAAAGTQAKPQASAGPARQAASAGKPKPSRAAGKASAPRPAPAEPRPAPAPSATPEASWPNPQLIYGILLVVAALVAFRIAGIFGFMIAMIFLPKYLRQALGIQSESDRRREAKRAARRGRGSSSGQDDSG